MGLENEASWKEDLKYKLRIRIYKQDLVFGPGVAELMQHIIETESLSEACRRMDMAYSKGWKIIKRAENDFGFSLVSGSRGGANGGKMVLTDQGREVLENYLLFEKELQEVSDQLFIKYFGESCHV